MYVCAYTHINRYCRYLYIYIYNIIHLIILHMSTPYSCITPFSSGVGRTGTFITLDATMERLKERDDIFEFVSEMRTRRKQMVHACGICPKKAWVGALLD